MLLLRTEKLPDSHDLLYEIKLDGYRAIAFRSGGKIHLRSRNDNDFAVRYAAVAKALQPMPEETVIDGEIVALDEDGRPSFNLLQNYGSSKTPLIYYAFDVMVLAGENVMGESLETRRSLLDGCWCTMNSCSSPRQSPSGLCAVFAARAAPLGSLPAFCAMRAACSPTIFQSSAVICCRGESFGSPGPG
jgi:ATP-dependent DNA ligase